MGTNYYLIVNPCFSCGRGDTKIHLGKASGGWKFSFKGYRTYDDYKLPAHGPKKVESIAEWKELVNYGLGYVEDEYGDRLAPDQMIDLALTWGAKRDKFHAKEFADSYNNLMIDGHSFSFQEFC